MKNLKEYLNESLLNESTQLIRDLKEDEARKIFSEKYKELCKEYKELKKCPEEFFFIACMKLVEWDDEAEVDYVDDMRFEERSESMESIALYNDNYGILFNYISSDYKPGKEKDVWRKGEWIDCAEDLERF